MEEFQKMLDTMVAKGWQSFRLDILFDNLILDPASVGYKNVMMIPPSSHPETIFATYLGFPYGAALLNETTGRCGRDGRMERALTETM